MNHSHIIRRAGLAVALCVSAASLNSLAAEAGDTLDIEVTAGGRSEKVSIERLAVGETRQLYSEAGTLVTATRTADSLELDIAGDKTSVPMFDPAAIDDPEIVALIESGHGKSESGAHRIVRIHADRHGDEHAGHGADEKHRRVMVFTGKDGTVHDLDSEAQVVIDKDGAGKHVIVKRRIIDTDAAKAD